MWSKSICSFTRWWAKTNVWSQSRAITLLKTNKISQIQSQATRPQYQSLSKVKRKFILYKFKIRNTLVLEKRTDWSSFQWYNIIPPSTPKHRHTCDWQDIKHDGPQSWRMALDFRSGRFPLVIHRKHKETLAHRGLENNWQYMQGLALLHR